MSNSFGGNITAKDVSTSSSLSKPLLTFSFDDGYRSDYEIVFKTFKEYGVRGTFFIIGKEDNLTNPLLMTAEMIKEMSDSGQEIASHGVEHIPYLLTNNEDIYEDMVNAKKFLENIIKRPVFSIAYPYGGGDNNTGMGTEADMVRVKAMTRGIYENGRGTSQYVTSNQNNMISNKNNLDKYNVACWLNDNLNPTPKSLIDDLISKGGSSWLNIAYHRIFEDGDTSKPTNRINETTFRSVVEYAVQKANEGLIDIVPFYEGARIMNS